MIKLVVIDFDDTLCLTEEATFFIENEVAVEMGYTPMTREAHKKNWGKNLSEAIIERVPGVDVEKFLYRLEEVHMAHASQGKVDTITAENLKALDQIVSSGLKLGLLTARSFREAQHLLHQDHPLSKRVERFYHLDNSEFAKPDPRAFNQILKDFNVEADKTIYIGDAFGDAICANGAGVHFVAVLESGIRTKDDFKSFQVDYFATTFVEAVNAILTGIIK
jgi:phosphoglycolate phosphatase-like HAD superfamily hydrolase